MRFTGLAGKGRGADDDFSACLREAAKQVWKAQIVTDRVTDPGKRRVVNDRLVTRADT